MTRSGCLSSLSRQNSSVGAKRWIGTKADCDCVGRISSRLRWKRESHLFRGPSVRPGVTSHRPFASGRMIVGGDPFFTPTTAMATIGRGIAIRTQSTAAGEDAYQRAIQLLRRAQEVEQEREQERSQKMYEAWQRSQDREQDSKTQGVKVIKTLVKETRKHLQGPDAGVNDADQDAKELLKQAAHVHRHPEAAVQLGSMLLKEASSNLKKRRPGDVDDSTMEKELVDEAVRLFRLAGEAGSRVGWYNLGQLFWTGFPPGDDDDDDDDEVAEVDERFHDIDDDDDEKNLHGKILPPDMHEAMEAFTRAIDLGDEDAMYLVGVHRLTQGGRENYHSGTTLIERAAQAGHGGALYYLALLHLNGEPNLGLEPCPLEEFMVRLDRAVEAGSSDARFTRGHSFYHGTEGYPQDFKRAWDDFLQAADEGHADAAVSAGAMLHHGVGVLKDQRRAFELYQLAGELGSEEGWVNVVDCWKQGLGVPKSEDTARHIEETMLTKRK